MDEETPKPGAKCRFYKGCLLYITGQLREEAEIELCGKGQPWDPNYRPRIRSQQTPLPEHVQGTLGLGDTCTAYDRFVRELFYGEVQGLVEKMEWYYESEDTPHAKTLEQTFGISLDWPNPNPDPLPGSEKP